MNMAKSSYCKNDRATRSVAVVGHAHIYLVLYHDSEDYYKLTNKLKVICSHQQPFVLYHQYISLPLPSTLLLSLILINLCLLPHTGNELSGGF